MTELDYEDAEGWHVMCACGHYVNGEVRPGQRIAVCPNCEVLLNAGERVGIVYPERLPDEYLGDADA